MSLDTTKDAVHTAVAAYTLGSGSLTVSTGTGSAFPAPSSSAPILVTVVSAGTYGQWPETFATYEATGLAGDTLTGLTLIDGVDTAWSVGDVVEMRVCSKHFADLQAGAKASIATVAAESSLPGSRRLVQGANITLTDNGPGSTLTIAAAGGGSGSVTTLSIISANGLAGTVATPTTTPAVTLSTTISGILKGVSGAITAAAAGTDYLVTNQTITLSGAVTGSGSTAIATTLAAGAVTYAKIQNETAATLLGNPTGSSAAPSEITLGAGLAFNGSSLTAPATAQGNFLISGGGVVWVSGYTFNVSAATYSIVGVIYNSSETSVTLTTADPTNPRYDLIIVDNTGAVGYVTGIPAVTPIVPIADPATQLALAIISVPAGSTTPPGITTVLLYDEDVGQPGEWNATEVGSGLVLNSTNNPYHATHDIEATTVAANTYFQLAATTAIDPTTVTQLAFHVRSKGAWLKKSLSIAWLNSGVQQGTAVALLDGVFNFQSNITTAYQQIVIPISLFSLAAGTLCNQLRFTVLGAGAAIGFYFDYAQLQSNANGTPAGYPQTIAPSTVLGNPSTTAAIPSAVTLGTGFVITGTSLGFQAPHLFTFLLGLSGNITTGTDVSNWLICPQPGVFRCWYAIGKTGPAGSSLIMDVQKSSNNGASFTSLWATHPTNKPTIAAAAVAGNGTSFDTLTFAAGDVLRVDVDQVGSTTPGATVTLVIEALMNP